MTDHSESQGTRREQVGRLRRRALLREAVVFQGKLLVDALKDLVLSPLSLIAVVFDLAEPPRRGTGRFAGVMQIGRGLERRIDLFGRAGQAEPKDAEWTVDDLVARFESSLREHAEASGTREAARQALEQTLAGLRGSGRNRE
jgi:hypothetical protein